MGTSGEPTVSFIIPARNEASYLPATLESLARLETTVAYEQIVVDGKSDDGTPEIAREFGNRYPTGVCPAVLVKTSGRRCISRTMASVSPKTNATSTKL